MTYNVFSGTLNPTQSINHTHANNFAKFRRILYQYSLSVIFGSTFIPKSSPRIKCVAALPCEIFGSFFTCSFCAILGSVHYVEFMIFCQWYILCSSALSALTLLVGRQERHPACKNRVMRSWHG